MLFHRKSGFFFIEGSLVLVAGIGVLSAAIFPSMTAYLKRSRDAGRMAHLNTIATSLGAYYSDKESYPISSDGCVPGEALKSYFPRTIPVDPTPRRVSGACEGNGGMTYGYGTYTKSSGFTGYYLVADMEYEYGGNSPRLPDSGDGEGFFDTLTPRSGQYYILTD